MTEKPIILGIETSCDETAVAIIQDDESGIPKILSNIISSQFDIHKEFERCSRTCCKIPCWKIDLIAKAIDESGVSLDKVSAIAATKVLV